MKKRTIRNTLAGCLAMTAGLAGAQQALHVVIPEKASVVERYVDGVQESLPTQTVWRYMCGSDSAGLTEADLLAIAANHADLVDQGVTTINNTAGRGGLDVIFNVSGSLPSGAAGAIALAEAAIESNFNDPTTVIVSLSFANLGSGVLGATGSSYVSSTWANSRAGLINGMDGDDTIQNFLPTGTTIPVRYNESSATVTNENLVFWTRANFKATIGSSGGSDASMQYNTGFSWDWDPTNGVSGSSYSFVDVIIHEVGHAMGFTSGSDFRTNDMEALDIFRFQRTDGTGTDYNPDTTAEFQTTPRTVDLINTDNQNSDIISVEYRMSDGSPYQTSHFREQGANIGIMDPAFGNGLSYFSRGYYAQSDIDMFDAIGYDVVDGVPPSIITQPSPDTVCAGQTAQLTVVASGDAPLTYQWFDIFLTPVSGGSNATLSIANAQESDEGLYFCRITNPVGTIDSGFAMITVDQGPSITDQPDTQTVNEGDNVTFTVVADGTPALSYQWKKGAANVGTNSPSYTINNATPADDGSYTVVVSNGCGNTTSSVATLTVTPASNPCAADTNGDGVLSPADFTAWVAAFNAQSAACDQNGDTLCTPADFTAWVANFNAGCP